MTAAHLAEMTLENLTKANDSADFLREELQAAHRNADAVESIVIMGLIEQAATLANRITELRGAIECRA